MSNPDMIIGVLREVAKLAKTMPIDEALECVANNLEIGLDSFRSGDTEALTYAQIRGGQFIGDVKH